MSVGKKSLELHELNRGKIEICSKVSVKNAEELSLAYSPGVAEPCKKIAENKEDVYKYTSKGNMVAVITDGSAVLGLGNIGPEAALPVMEGKSILFKEFANVDSYPVCVNSQDVEEIIKFCKLIAPGLGGINLEDISAPRCVEIERRLIEELDIPVFHDDQHGTAIVTTAALINSAKLTNKRIEEMQITLSGTGAAGSSIAKMLKKLGVKKLYAYNKDGVVTRKKYNSYDFLVKELIDDNVIDEPEFYKNGTLDEIVRGSDVFVGVSVSNILTKEMVKTMNKDAIIFAMANPSPEILPEAAKEAGARVVGTGRSDYPNQVNNVLAFPGLFRGALDARAPKITENMKFAAAKAIAELIKIEELNDDYVIPNPFDKRVAQAVAQAVIKETKGER